MWPIASVPTSERGKAVAPLIGYRTFHPQIDDDFSPQLLFPLSIDHLITLVQVNVLRGVLTNMSILSLHPIPNPECSKTIQAALLPLFPAPSSIPESLLPTPLQESTPHEPWIDLIPDSTMRDNAIRLAGTFDEHDLCTDLVGGLYEGFNDCENKGMLVWSDPWHSSGWEVTEGFLAKWGFLVKGSPDVLRSTNEWRAVRGEEPLVWELE
jgi:Domain of unknown function (DUF3425)